MGTRKEDMKMKAIQVLMIADNKNDIHLIKEFLSESDLAIKLECIDRIEKGLTALNQEDNDVVLLDIGLPGSQGLKALGRVSGKAPHIPIIVLTGYDDQGLGIESISKGAQDYLIKQEINSHLLSRSITHAIQRKRIELELKNVNRELRDTVEKLQEANRRILENQKSVIEEERLKALLEMSGTTAHELNQPLTSLLGHIELMKLRKDDPPKLARHIDIIESSGKRIADIAKKISDLGLNDKKSYSSDSFIIDIHREIKLLSVEDSDRDFEKIHNFLKDNDKIKLSRALSIEESMNMLKQGTFDLIILDYLLPDGNGIDFFKIMKKRDIEIPVVVNTAYGDELIASQLIKEGAYDYISKQNINKKSLYRSINNALEKFRLKKEIKKAWEKMAKMATKDELTGLYNRRYFLEIFEREVERARRYENKLIFCIIDLDHFKTVNEAYNHLAGDMVLAEIGKILSRGIRLSDLACRFGGEEFAILLPSTDIEEASLVCERLRKVIGEHRFEYKSSPFKVTVSVGVAMFNRHGDHSPVNLLEKADQALYQAKNSGGNKVAVHTPGT
jgi:two-component system cell cycle response regulator